MSSNDKSRLQALDAAVESFGKAWASGNVSVLEELLSPTYTHNDAFGAHHDRASWLAYVEGRAGRRTRIKFRNVETRIRGDLAIVTGINDIKGAGATSATDQRDFSIQFTQVWFWQDGRWLREAFQATPMKVP